MINKKQFIAITIFLLFIGSFVLLKHKGQKDARKANFTIGILQTASHPALDAARQGFMQEINDLLPNQVEFIIKNAQGSVNNAHTIAQSFHSNASVGSIFAIATPALQAIAAIEPHKPIFFAAVTDPRSLGIMTPTTNIAGSSDTINIPDTITLLKELIPTAKTVAIMYSTAELGSTQMAIEMKKELEKISLKPLMVGITCEADVISAITNALQQSDALLTPIDNTIACAIDLIINQALLAKKPLIVSDSLLVEKGALAARGVNYKNNGRQAAQLAAAVLKSGKKPYELPIAYSSNARIIINKETLDTLGLTIPESLKDEVSLVKDTVKEKNDFLKFSDQDMLLK